MRRPPAPLGRPRRSAESMPTTGRVEPPRTSSRRDTVPHRRSNGPPWTASGWSRMAAIGPAAIALRMIGSAPVPMLLNPENSGIENGLSTSRSAPVRVVFASAGGSGESRTVVTTAPIAPAQATGTARTNAPAAWSGLTAVAAPAPIIAATIEEQRGRDQVVRVQPAAGLGEPIGQVWSVHLLGERFERLRARGGRPLRRAGSRTATTT